MSDNIQALFKDTLKARDFSLTRTRQLIFELLKDKEPQSIYELYVRGQNKFDRASLYRTINLFESLGIAQRVHFGWKYKLELTDRFAHHHHHLSCLSCGRVLPIKEDKSLERMIEELSKEQSFHAQKHQIEIQGLCATCQATRQSTK